MKAALSRGRVQRDVRLPLPQFEARAAASGLRRQAVLTPELTGREVLREAFNLADDIQADSAPVE
jgi:hypothetical protein